MHASSDVDARGSEHRSDATKTSKRWRQRDAVSRPRRTRSVLSRLVVVLIAVLMMTPAAYNRGAPSAALPAAVIAPAHIRLTGTPVPPPLITFTGPTEYSYGTTQRPNPNPTHVVIADVNGDGHQDLVVDDGDNTTGDYSVRIELGSGSGTVTESAGYVVPNRPGRLVVTDLNGDGKPDIVVGQGAAGVAVLLNNGSGTFGAPTLYAANFPSGSSNGSVDGLALGVLTSNGIPDIVTGDGNISDGSSSGGYYSVLLGNGDGTFQPAHSYGPFNPPFPNGGTYGMQGIALGDFNGDGRVDIAAAIGVSSSVGQTGVEVLLGNGDGTFTYETAYATGDYLNGTENVTVGDLNTDHKLDIIVSIVSCGGDDGNETSVLTGKGDGTFGQPANLGNSCVVGDQVLTDINGDGVPDLAVVTGDSPLDSNTFLHVFTANGDGALTDAGEYPTAPGLGSSGIAAGDLNGDGKPDLVTANGSSYDLSIFLNTSVKAPIGGPIRPAELPGGVCPACLAKTQANTKNPVDTATGDFWHVFSDVDIPGRGIPLAFTHTYNAVDAVSTGPLGFGWTFAFNTSLSINATTGAVTVNEESGAQEVFDPASGGGYTTAPRVITTLVHNGGGTYTMVVRNRTTYTFAATGQLLSEQALNGYTTSLSYNGSNQLTTIADQAGRTLSIGWTGSHITTVTDTNVTPNRVVTFQYNDSNGNLTDVIDVNGGHTHFTYDTNHRLTNFLDPNCYAAGSGCNGGNGLVNGYDSSGRVATQTDDLGRITHFGYTGNPEFSSTTTITDPANNVVVDSYQYGELVEATKGSGTPAAASWLYGYDPATTGTTSVTDPNGGVTTTTYDAQGDVLSTLDPLRRTTSATYNSFDEPLTTVDGNNVTTTNTYDANGNLKSASTPLVGSSPLQHRVTTYTYGDSGHPGDLTVLQDPDGKNWTYTYSAHGDRATMTDPLGNISTTCYNAIGWKTATYPPRAGSITCANPPPTSPYYTTYNYVQTNSQIDQFGDVQTVTDPLGHTTKYAYDTDRNLLTLTDGDSNVTTYVYDLDSEQTQIRRADSPQTTLVTDYNPDGTVMDQKDGKGNKTLTYGYDSLGRVITEADADNNTTTYALDGYGNVLTTQLPGGSCPGTACITHTYDVDNELKTVTYSDGTTPNITNATYDGDGHRQTIADGTGTTTDVWDSLGRLTSDQNGAGALVGYGYDLKGQLTSLTYPGALTVNYGYDIAGRLTTVQDWLGNTTTYTPSADSFDTSIAYQNGVTATQTPDNADRLMGITDKHSLTTLASMTYTRDGNNQLTGETDTGLTQVAQPFTYTALNQVKAAGSNTYGYDAADNLSKLSSGTNQLFDPATELCWSSTNAGTSCSSPPSGATTYTYDSRGNRTKSTTGSTSITYGYDEASRLSSYTSSTQTATYRYNGDGLRMSKTVNGVTTPFTWNTASSAPLLLSDGTTDYIYGANGTPIEHETARPAISWVGDTTATGGTGATTLTLNLPAGVQANDQVFVDSSQSAGTTVTAPSAYTLVASVATGGTTPKGSTSVFRHTVIAGDTSVILTYGGTSSVKAVVLAVYRGVDPSLPVDAFATSQSAGVTAVVAPSITPAYANDRLLVFQGARGTFSPSTWTPPSGTNEQVQVNSQANVSAGLADQTLTAAGATGTRTSTFGVAANLTTVIVAIPQPSSVLFYQTDQLGSTRLLTDSAGVVRGTFSYDGYGNSVGSTGSYTTLLSYAAQYRDAESGLIYLRARYYDPTTAQFLSRDPIVATTREPYAYVSGNPLKSSDPSGLHVACGGVDNSGGGAGYSGTDSCANDIPWTGPLPSFTVGVSGICFSVGAFLIRGAMGSTCLVFGGGHVAITVTGGIGVGVGAGVSGGIEGANATCPSALQGTFIEAGGGLGPLAGNGQISPDGKTAVGYGGFGVGTLGEGYAGATETLVLNLF
jgi:RHS repeat-associated protein